MTLRMSFREINPSVVVCPCFSAFRLPKGAPGDAPPCIRQRPFSIAGDWHAPPARRLAPHLAAAAKAWRPLNQCRFDECMGSISEFPWKVSEFAPSATAELAQMQGLARAARSMVSAPGDECMGLFFRPLREVFVSVPFASIFPSPPCRSAKCLMGRRGVDNFGSKSPLLAWGECREAAKGATKHPQRPLAPFVAPLRSVASHPPLRWGKN
jgi:hypothetical protein